MYTEMAFTKLCLSFFYGEMSVIFTSRGSITLKGFEPIISFFFLSVSEINNVWNSCLLIIHAHFFYLFPMDSIDYVCLVSGDEET